MDNIFWLTGNYFITGNLCNKQPKYSVLSYEPWNLPIVADSNNYLDVFSKLNIIGKGIKNQPFYIHNLNIFYDSRNSSPIEEDEFGIVQLDYLLKMCLQIPDLGFHFDIQGCYFYAITDKTTEEEINHLYSFVTPVKVNHGYNAICPKCNQRSAYQGFLGDWDCNNCGKF